MRISRVHVEAELVVGDQITFDGDRNHYLKHVLRLKSGAAVDLFNGDGNDYRATIYLDGKNLSATVDSAATCNTESNLHTTIIQAVGKADHLDWMIQKTTELGVNRIVLFNAEHTQHPIKNAQLGKKDAHWRRVAISACEQSGRGRIPQIAYSLNLREAIVESNADIKLVLDCGGESIASQAVNPVSSIAILTGPEGGLTQSELEFASNSGFRTASLGPRILRFETAAVSALAITQTLINGEP